MYDKEAIRKRFFEEVERLKSIGVAETDIVLADLCGLQRQVIYDLRYKPTALSMQVLVNFVQAYRRYNVSYSYILEGTHEKPTERAASQLDKVKEELRKTLTVLENL